MDVIKNLSAVDFFKSATKYQPFCAKSIAHGFEINPNEHCDVHHVRQVHGNKIINISDTELAEKSIAIEADGIFCNKPGVKVGVKTADCLPVLFKSPSAVCATHAGWRGLSKNIISNSLSLFPPDDITTNNLNVIIGPAISVSNFEVGPEVVEAFEDYSKQIGKDAFFACLTKGLSDRWYIDLQQLAIFECISNGVQANNIAVMRVCTMGQPYWHSYRRSGKDAGRILSWIQL